MYLKEIHMQGFKSFADKTKVVFDRGVTAVVGPNGSGKSNITESLRWALGESSAKSLRGGKMPDVIFAGTENRKPLNFASVTVVLDNSDQFITDKGKEIKVERQIYRNGDSEYLIDGKKVRLKDIHDLFMDTGLGRDSFSIISQGRVEAIFNSKPEERRAIFEEAAGVLKYKTRKRETESKLNQTQDNLDRLEDIIYELDTQIAPLTKQAETARQFLALDGERKDLYLNVLVGQIKLGKDQLTQLENQLDQVQVALQTYYSQRDQMEADNQALKQRRQELQVKGEKLQGDLVHLTQLIADLEQKIALQDLEANQNEASRAEASERLEVLNDRYNKTQEDLKAKEEALADLDKRLKQVILEIEGLTQESRQFSKSPDQVIESLREDFVQLMQTEADKSNQLTALTNQVKHLKEQSVSQATELVKLEEEVKAVRHATADSQTTYQKAQQEVQNLMVTYQQEAKAEASLNQDYQTKQEAMFTLMDQIKTAEARAQTLANILKNHTNFFAGVRSVLQASNQLSGIIGAVSEHVTFNPKYQTAIEIAMGAASQHVMVADEKAATQAIAFLKKNRQGRATFLPLTTIKPRQLASHQLSQVTNQPGFLGLAVDLVDFDPTHANIFQNLLGTTAIFESLEEANQAARKTQFQVRLVTLDGSEIRTGGAYAGGASRQNNSNFIKPELDQLQGTLLRLKAELGQVESQVEQAKSDLNQQQLALAHLKEAGEVARLNEQKAQLQHESQAKHLADLETLLTLKANENGLSDLSRLEEARQALKSELDQIEADKQALSQRIEQVKGDKEAVESHLQTLQASLSAAKLQENQLQSEKGFAQTEQARLQEDLTRLHQEIIALEAVIADKTLQLSTADKESLLAQMADCQSRKEVLSQEQIRHRFEMEDLEGQAEDLASRLAESRTRNEDLIRQQTKLEAEIEHLSERLRQFLAKLAEEFQLTFDAAHHQAQPLEDLEGSEQALKQLEGKIRRLGPVNLEAIAQFEEVSQRLAFLSDQREDLLSAKTLLLETIREMDMEVKERFKETFEAIRVSFQQTFRQMFGGGSADLILTDSDLLTAGIEISVQPPGKKIQSLNLMSGGEKALSALALLFAIIRVKTIPFVILDEVEAALDEANVKRFGDYLNRFDKASQFIVVTHRKGTMAAADAMYGVTMQESGVSKIVSVKLKDVEGIVK
ncbi:chromosome segregation protein SMC [Streptococcus ovuberis]|uniref:Chromosome partition protein Smc n=1 Tax=Streptococcus ovuberis TaxID=1936207 RepID=A0A7X6MWS0_9STRE|nr:chromosome segregation protein SMC [Streptococcus ovuberis]NKZ19341.1 chromosome segregation protein SMC [Streptococcus ovuberis]